jgi:DNA-binding LytR/AlgR family response regulator
MNEPLKILIVEDDPLIAFDIKCILESKNHQVLAVCHTAKDAMLVDLSNIDIALLDVNLGDGPDGISVAMYLKENAQIPCIFITSYYDEKTVSRAKTVYPLAYIIKPYEEQDILINLELATSKLKKEVKKEENAPIFVKNGSKLTKIDPKDVDFIQAYDMYSHLFIAGKRITASQTLKETEKLFSHLDFIRVHRSYVVNLNAIEGIYEDEILIAEHRIPVGRTYKKDLFDRIVTI